MPLYEYTCERCDHRFEKLTRSMAAKDKPACPACGSKKTARAFSVFAVGTQDSSASPGGDAPMCGRCGGPGPCGREE